METSGPTGGQVVFFRTGTPAAGEIAASQVAAGAERGLRHVAYSRPGDARSARHAGRSAADCAADVAAIADGLGIDGFVTAGLSGGGPHALACAALLGERVLAAATIGSVAPFHADGLDWLYGMGQENLDEFAAVNDGEVALRAYLARACEARLRDGRRDRGDVRRSERSSTSCSAPRRDRRDGRGRS